MRRICGVYKEDNGDVSAVWLKHNKDTDMVTLYDACTFKHEVLVVIAEGINARGRDIPVAWLKGQKDFADELKERGVRILVDETVDDTDMISREIDTRMKIKTLKIESRLKNWIDEAKTFYNQGAKVPVDGYPLMTATRLAIKNLKRARGPMKKRVKNKYPKVAMV